MREIDFDIWLLYPWNRSNAFQVVIMALSFKMILGRLSSKMAVYLPPSFCLLRWCLALETGTSEGQGSITVGQTIDVWLSAYSFL
jgi:hypothetical protein